MAKRGGASAAITRGSTNIFEQLGYRNPVERQARLRLAYALNQIIDHQGLNQGAAATRLKLSQSEVSALRHYKLAGFSVERLMTFLTDVGHDVEIVIKNKPRSRQSARITVVAAGTGEWRAR
jgi:predicted XRE-type DNA-binding protein